MSSLSILNNWVFNMAMYIIFIIVFSQSYKLAVKNAKHDGAATILLQLMGAISILFFIPLFPFKFTSDLKLWVILLLACVFYTATDRLNTSVRKHLPVSTYSILAQLPTVFLVFFGFTFFNEPFLLNKAVGALLVVLGNVLLIYKRGAFVVNKYIWWSVLASLAFAIALSIDIGISLSFNLPVYIALTLGIPAILLLIGEKISVANIVEEFNSEARKYYLLTGISWGILILFSLRSFQLGEVTTVVPLTGLAVLLNVLVAYVVFHEREDRLKKLLAALIVVAGVIITV